MEIDRSERVLVTGGAGFIGSHLVTQLVSAGHRVRVLEKPGADCSHLPNDGVELVHADIRDANEVEAATRGCGVVLHLAANPNLWAKDSREFEEVNHQGTRHVLAASRRAGVGRTVYVSTESILAPARNSAVITESTRTAIEDMLGPYCRSKWLAEQAARESAEVGEPVMIARPSIPVGPGDRRMGPPSRMICDFCNGRIKGYLRGDLNLIDVRDIAAGIWAVAQRGEIGRPYLLVNEQWTILELLSLLSEVTGRPTPRWRVPYLGALAFAHLEEMFCRHVTGHPPMATVTGVRLTKRTFQFDGRRSASELGLEPLRSCRESIIESIRWFESTGSIRDGEVAQTSASAST